MATKIVTKNSSTASAVPTASDLVQGELAVNVADKRLFTEDNTGTIVELGTNPSTIDINAGSIDGTAIGASSASTGAFTTLTATGLTVDTNTLYVDSTNNRVGIGTTSPNANLDIESSNATLHLTDSDDNTYAEVRNNGGTLTIGSDVGASAGGSSINFKVDNTERVRIDSSGRVGIGTTSPDTLLTVADDTADQIKIGDTTDTNFWSLRAGTNFIVKDNDVERMRIDSSGRVGIGTTSPSRTLHLKEAVPSIRLEDTDVSGVYHEIISEANTGYCIRVDEGNVSSGSYFRVDIDNSEKMRIDSSGNVGIGTSSPSSRLDVAGSSNSTYLKVGGDDASNGRALTFTSSASASFNGAVHTINAPSSQGVIALATGSTERMRIDSSGNVGIGTSSPAKTLTVAGTGLRVQSTASADFYSTGQDALIVNNGTANLRFWNNGSERMRINSSGNVLVGTTTAEGKQTITQSTSGGIGAVVNFSGSGGVGYHAKFLSSSGTAYFGWWKYNGSVVGSITSTGSSTSYNTSSDYRLKENVVELTGATKRLKQLNPSRFNFIADADTTVDGFLAHEVADVVPEAVSGEKDAVDADGNPEYQGIDQSKLVPLLVATIQELEARITQLENN